MSGPAYIIKRNITTTERHEITLTGKDVLHLLRATGLRIPDKAIMEFAVPGGGDWSNTDIAVDGDNPLTISWQTIKEE